MYEKGHGTAQDYKKAVEWYRKAAEQNEPSAQYSLGLMYEQGTGVAPSLEEATRWYRLAAKNGDPDARAALRAQGKTISVPVKQVQTPQKNRNGAKQKTEVRRVGN